MTKEMEDLKVQLAANSVEIAGLLRELSVRKREIAALQQEKQIPVNTLKRASEENLVESPTKQIKPDDPIEEDEQDPAKSVC